MSAGGGGLVRESTVELLIDGAAAGRFVVHAAYVYLSACVRAGQDFNFASFMYVGCDFAGHDVRGPGLDGATTDPFPAADLQNLAQQFRYNDQVVVRLSRTTGRGILSHDADVAVAHGAAYCARFLFWVVHGAELKVLSNEY